MPNKPKMIWILCQHCKRPDKVWTSVGSAAAAANALAMVGNTEGISFQDRDQTG